jgi:hypothetical protein
LKNARRGERRRRDRETDASLVDESSDANAKE